MQRFFCRNPLSPPSTLLAILALVLAAFLPFGSVAAASSICGSEEPFCDLAISAPDSVATGQPFTVQVALGVSGEGGFMPLPKNDPCASNVVVTLQVTALATDESSQVIATYVVNAKKGVATFTVGGIPATFSDEEGTHTIVTVQLRASAVQTTGSCDYFSEFVDVRVVTVPAGQPIAPCPNDVPCTQTTSGGGTAATLFAAGGDGSFTPAADDSFFVSLAFLGTGGCGDGGPPDTNGVLGYHFSDPVPTKTIILEVSPALVNKGIGQINVCWSTDAIHWVFLPACSKSNGPPCVAHKNGLPQHGAFIEIDVPAGAGDPFAYEE